jgi:hypothetical protein
MKRYQTENERELDPVPTADLFRKALAGVFPGWRFGCSVARALDDTILEIPGLRNLGSNFEIIARIMHKDA